MEFISTRDTRHRCQISTAMQVGLAADGGLYVPEYFPSIDWAHLPADMSYARFASHVLAPFFEGDKLAEDLSDICEQAFNFPVPVTALDNGDRVLELFHGPTLSFKDFGARFLANCLVRLSGEATNTIMVATSGDTGSAVAAAFYNQPDTRVVVLFPDGRISARQQQQITCWGGNVLALAVDGAFDDCQALVKQAFSDPAWTGQTRMNTSNSINIGRLLPQMVYYAYSAWQYYLAWGRKANYIVPTGNIGNVCAAYWARELGFPVGEIIISQNANNTIGAYLRSGHYTPRASIETLANAMDVGRPSNIERLFHLYPDFETFRRQVTAVMVTDEAIAETIRRVASEYGQQICPHTATAFYARDRAGSDHLSYIMVATAHPAKFEQIIEPILGQQVAMPDTLTAMLQAPQHYQCIEASMQAMRAHYTDYFQTAGAEGSAGETG